MTFNANMQAVAEQVLEVRFSTDAGGGARTLPRRGDKPTTL